MGLSFTVGNLKPMTNGVSFYLLYYTVSVMFSPSGCSALLITNITSLDIIIEKLSDGVWSLVVWCVIYLNIYK